MNAICEKFVYLHPIRSGGTWVTEILQNLGLIRIYRRYSSELHLGNVIHHKPEHGITWAERAADMPRFTFIRDPFEWYVSFTAAPKNESPFEERLKDNVFGRKYTSWVYPVLDEEELHGPLTIYPFTEIRQRLREYLESFGYDGSLAMTHPIPNASKHGPWQDYFDDEMISMVKEETDDWVKRVFQ